MSNMIVLNNEQEAREALWKMAEPFARKRGGDSISRKCFNAGATTKSFYGFTNGRQGIGLRTFISLAKEFGHDVVLTKHRDTDGDEHNIVPPVKLGDKVYFICEEFDEYGGDYIDELTVTEVSNVRFWVQNEDENHFRYTDIGKIVFLTEVEAQSVLKRKEKIGVDTDKCGLRRHHAQIS